MHRHKGNHANIKILSFCLEGTYMEYIYFVKYESCFRTPQNDFIRNYVELFCLYDLYIYRKISLKFYNLPKTYMEDKWMNKIEKEKKNSMQFPCASKYEN